MNGYADAARLWRRVRAGGSGHSCTGTVRMGRIVGYELMRRMQARSSQHISSQKCLQRFLVKRQQLLF
jgi:hypothetical protein